jgi:hypothetical protein
MEINKAQHPFFSLDFLEKAKSNTYTLPLVSGHPPPVAQMQRLPEAVCAYSVAPLPSEYEYENARRALLLDCNRSVLDFRQQNFPVDVTDTFLLGYVPGRRAHTILLHGCTHCTDTGLSHLLACCPNVTNLDLCRCTQITGDGLQGLTTHCKQLSLLRLTGCWDITDNGLQSLALALPDLTLSF